jgi:uncharacterized membrane protein
MLAAIEWDLIGEVIWVSLVAGIGVTLLFSLVVYGSSRAAEARRAGDNPTIFGVVALVALLAFAGVVVFALTVILNKS